MTTESEARDRKEILKHSFLKIKELQLRLKQVEAQQHEPIAIIGAGCRLPGGAHDLDSFWRVLREGVDTISEIPADRWDADIYFDPDPDVIGKMYTRCGAFLSQVDQFDAHFFNIAPREAAQLDPQQRLLLEVAWEALEMAGQAPEIIAGSATGVFIGMTTSDYATLQSRTTSTEYIDTYFGTGVANSVASGRIAYVLGLRGPCMTIDTACSSSLVALHLACQSLHVGESRMALAGGVSLILAPDSHIIACKGKMLSRDGRCKTFDAAADGYGRGEGCGVVVLKRLSDAKADGDPILGLILGSAINQDGKSAGLTAPNGIAQEEVMRKALQNARLVAADVGYIETHGTGTVLGDPIEIQALGAVYGAGHSREDPLLVGSVKTNVGHLEAAAGIAGLLKVLLAFRHAEIPPHLHFETPNPHIPWESMPIEVVTRRRPWPENPRGPIAGLSSFGFSGTNSHFILQGPPALETLAVAAARPSNLLALSAKTPGALLASAGNYVRYFDQRLSDPIDDVCFTANTGRGHFNCRLAVIGKTAEDLREGLLSFRDGPPSPRVLHGESFSKNPPPVAMLFTGQGSQAVGMGRALYDTQPVYQNALDRCHEALRGHLDKPLLNVLYPASGTEREAQILVNQTGFAQPLLFAVEYALSELWKSWGIEPTAVMGHSVGEYVAACVAGVFSLEDGLRLIAERAKRMQALPPGGAMAAVFAAADTVTAALGGGRDSTVCVAALNSPQNTVIAGPETDIAIVLERLKAKGIGSQQLLVSHAFHSPLMAPMLPDFRKVAATVQYAEPRIDLVSNVTGQMVAGDLTDPAYWCRHVSEPVQFMVSIQTLYDRGYRLFVEAGPHPTLLSLGVQCLQKPDCIWVPSLRRGQDDLDEMLKALGLLYTNGMNVNWRGFEQGGNRRRLQLPTYPFQRKRYWKSTAISSATSTKPVANLQPETSRGMLDQSVYLIQWRINGRPREDLDSDPGGVPSMGRWILFCDQGGTGDQIVEWLGRKGFTSLCIRPSDRYESCGGREIHIRPDRAEDYVRCAEDIFSPEDPKVSGIIYLWGMDTTITEKTLPADMEKIHLFSLGSLLHLVQALARVRQAPQPKLWVATRNAQSESRDSGPISIAQTPLWGFGRVIAEELPDVWGGCVDFGTGPADEEIEAFLNDVFQPTRDNQIVYRGKRRYVARFARERLSPSEEKEISCRQDATYLITGGLGGIGLWIARELVRRNACNMVLMSRSGLTPSVQDAVAELRHTGANVVVTRGDVSREDIEKVLAHISSSMPPLRGIIHAAGTVQDGVLIKLSWQSFLNVMAPKISGAWNLHALTREMPLEFFVLCSSMASLTGSPGQGNYAAANAFLDGLAHYRHAIGLPVLCVNWGAWAGVGMTRVLGDRDAARRAEMGITDIQPVHGVRILERLMSSEVVQTAVLPIEWQTFFRQFQQGKVPTLFTDIFKEISSRGDTRQAGDKGETSSLLDDILQAPANARSDLVFDHIRRQVIRVLRLDMSQPVDFRMGLTEIGMDSLMAVELRNLLQVDFKKSIPTSVIFEYPTIRQLSDYIVNELISGSPVAEPPHQPGKEEAQPRYDKTLREMSEDEAEESLIAELNRQGF